MAPYLMQVLLNQDLITSITSEDIVVDKDYRFKIELDEILKNWYQFENYTIKFYMKDIEKMRSGITLEESDMVQLHPLCLLPDVRVDLSLKKNNRRYDDEDVDSESEEEEEEDIMMINSEMKILII